jgi:proline racemase
MIRTIDAHVGGQAVRLIVEGLPVDADAPGGKAAPIGGRSLAARIDRFRHAADGIRRSLVRPPRGHDGLIAAVLSEPVTPGAHAALIGMDADGYPPLAGHAVIAAATIAIERGLLFIGERTPEMRLVFDTLAGTVATTVRVQERAAAARVDSVAMVNVPAFVHTAAQPVRVGPRELRVDIAFGGMFHAIIDTEAIGIPLELSRLPELRRLAIDLLASLHATARVEHPGNPALRGVSAVTITGVPRDPEAHLRNVTISASGAVDPSPGVTGTSAVMAVLSAMGLLLDDQPFVHEGLSGALLRGRPLRSAAIGEVAALVTEITATAWITGDHTFVLDDDDPLREGF